MREFQVDPARLHRLTTLSAVLGGAAWLILGALGIFTRFEWLLLLSPLVVVEVLVHQLDRSFQSRFQQYALLAQPIGATALLVSFTQPAGVRGALLALPWFFVTLLVALWGVQRVGYRGFRPIAALAVDAGLLYLPVGGGWLLLSRAGLTPLDFGPLIVFFTAVHFHYAGFAVATLAGLAGRAIDYTRSHRRRLWYRWSTLAIIIGPGLIAAGITLSPIVEIVSVVILTAAITSFGLGVLAWLVPRRTHPLQQLLLAIGATAVSVSMVFALVFGLSVFLERQLFGLTIETMVRLHGQLNAIGFALLSAVGWAIDPPPTLQPATVSLSALSSNGRVGSDYLSRNDLDGPGTPIGQLRSLAAYERDDFDPTAVDPAVRRFYERTAEYELDYELTYHAGFRLLAQLGTRLTTKIGQLALPGPDAGSHRTNSRIVDVNDDADGRDDVRAWIREDMTTGDAVFVAAYTTDLSGDGATMSIGLPLPWSTLSAVLWMEALPDSAGLSLRSDGPTTDTGMFIRTPIGPLRLPMHETFRIRPAPDQSIECTAEHRMWLFGRPFLTIVYDISIE